MTGLGFIRCVDGGNGGWRNTPSVGNRRLAEESPLCGLDNCSRRIYSMAGKDRKRTMKRAGAFYQLVYHFAWSTKNRLPLITPEVETRLYPYVGYKCKELGYRLHAVNGMEEHIHVLVSLTPSHLVADVAKNLKGASSHYINKESGLDTTLYWQDGYGVVTIRESEIPKVARYIRDQKQHHRDGTLSELLEKMQE